MEFQLLTRKNEYKGVIAVVSRPQQPFTTVSTHFAARFNHELRSTWTLIDPKGNEHVVKYDRSLLNPCISEGWMQIRYFYGLDKVIWCLLKYVGHSVFDLFIYNYNGGEISYDKAIITSSSVITSSKPLCASCRPSPTFTPCFFTVKLSRYQATGSQLNLPKHVAHYLRYFQVLNWILKGPTGIQAPCVILASVGKTGAKIGRGWKHFCILHGLSAGNALTLRFTSSQVRIINVDIHH